MTSPEFSIVIPVFNSESTLAELCSEIEKAMASFSYELILVDDGSKDDSWAQIVQLKSVYKEKITGIRLARNFGQHNALFCGFSYAKGNAVITMDDDLQHPPSELPKLIGKFQSADADVVYGIYSSKQHSSLRNAGSELAQKSSKMVIGNYGQGSSFRIIHKSLISKILIHKNQAHIYIDELLHWYTSQFDQVEVEHHPRKSGKSGYTFFRLLFIYFDTVINYTAVPLKMMTWIGLLSSLITFGMGAIFIYRKLFHEIKPGFTAQIVAILFSTSLLMFCMGIIGQYLYKIYHLQSGRPSWSVNQVI